MGAAAGGTVGANIGLCESCKSCNAQTALAVSSVPIRDVTEEEIVPPQLARPLKFNDVAGEYVEDAMPSTTMDAITLRPTPAPADCDVKKTCLEKRTLDCELHYAEGDGQKTRPCMGASKSFDNKPTKGSGDTSATARSQMGKSTKMLLRSASKLLGLSEPTQGPLPVRGSNPNCPEDYRWLNVIFSSIVSGEAVGLGCTDESLGQNITPIFIVFGACPNFFCGMQAIMYSVTVDNAVDFWWVKPLKNSSNDTLDDNTLSLHSRGPYKNDPGRSKQFYKPLAELFEQGKIQNGLRFGLQRVGGGLPGSSARAYLERIEATGSAGERCYIVSVWQEDWTTNIFARSKFIKGKIVYQRVVQSDKLFSRQYEILDSIMRVSECEEPVTLPLGDSLKWLREF